MLWGFTPGKCVFASCLGPPAKELTQDLLVKLVAKTPPRKNAARRHMAKTIPGQSMAIHPFDACTKPDEP